MAENGSPVSLAGDDRAGLLCSAASDPTDSPTLNELQAPAGPSPEATAVCDEFVLDELFRAFDRIESYAISGREAAKRGDRDEVKLRLRIQLRDCFRYAVQIHDLLSSGHPQGSGS